ncbi:Hypothetical Protein FCC1311_036712 [Hondaea fermentalgiana]|uniref:Uncharacterized protein n=1 Tax=Hondaea fermentalgiana TaxID=2315210 RepID=A0A2R5G8X1_9STRA|nr:Hypothetical Protein FCC1311_036712 [Hondaea fermentalgiana]|eukprot:GBG27450.1 Hypothetical Protein FCC1311_036712 [Hondaea fermentalgiana]
MTSNAADSASSCSAVLAVDIGSSSVRAAVYVANDENFLPELVPESAQQRAFQLREDTGANELVQEIEAAVAACCQALGPNKSIDDVALSCFAMNLVGLNKVGDPCTPLLTYAGSSPSIIKASEMLHNELADAGRLQSIRSRTGTTMSHTSYAACQMRALDEENALDNVDVFVSLPTLLLRRWTTASQLAAVSPSEASWTGLINLASLDWDEAARAMLPPRAAAALPEIKTDIAMVADLKAKADLWPQMRNARFHLGIADGLAANVGSMCVDARSMAVTVGTSAAARILLNRSQVPLGASDFPPRGLWCYCADGERVLLGGALTDGGSLYRWVEDMIRLPADADARAEACAPGSHGLIVLPFLRGERSMGWNDKAAMTISGISQSTQPHEILHAVMESLAIRIGELIAAIAEAASPGRPRLVASGTALAKSPLLQRLIADVTGKDLLSSRWAREEATSRGVAMLALETSSSQSSVEGNGEANDSQGFLAKVAAKAEAGLAIARSPAASRHALYTDEIVPRHRTLYASLFPN